MQYQITQAELLAIHANHRRLMIETWIGACLLAFVGLPAIAYLWLSV